MSTTSLLSFSPAVRAGWAGPPRLPGFAPAAGKVPVRVVSISILVSHYNE